MATDTFTCSRCGQVSYYRDGSYLFGQQIVCARCYATQAAPPPAGTVPVAGMVATPVPPMGYPGAQGAYAPPPPRSNVCGLLGFLCAVLAIGCVVFMSVALSKHTGFFEKLRQEALKGESAQPEIQRMLREWVEKNPEVQGGVLVGVCGFGVFLIAGLILSIVGVCLSNVRKGMAIAGLVLNGLLLIASCGVPCLSGMMPH